jgi:hypothetical protein
MTEEKRFRRYAMFVTADGYVEPKEIPDGAYVLVADLQAGGATTKPRMNSSGGSPQGEDAMTGYSLSNLIDCLRHRPVATTAAQMREAADAIEELQAQIALREQSDSHARCDAEIKGLHAALEMFAKQWEACGPNSDFGRYFQSVYSAARKALKSEYPTDASSKWEVRCTECGARARYWETAT